MANVQVQLNGKSYGIDCGDGQEARVQKLADYISSRMDDVKSAGAATTEDQLFMITSLIITDELFEIKEKSANGNNATSASDFDEDRLSKVINGISDRITSLTKEVERL